MRVKLLIASILCLNVVKVSANADCGGSNKTTTLKVVGKTGSGGGASNCVTGGNYAPPAPPSPPPAPPAGPPTAPPATPPMPMVIPVPMPCNTGYPPSPPGYNQPPPPGYTPPPPGYNQPPPPQVRSTPPAHTVTKVKTEVLTTALVCDEDGGSTPNEPETPGYNQPPPPGYTPPPPPPPMVVPPPIVMMMPPPPQFAPPTPSTGTPGPPAQQVCAAPPPPPKKVRVVQQQPPVQVVQRPPPPPPQQVVMQPPAPSGGTCTCDTTAPSTGQSSGGSVNCFDQTNSDLKACESGSSYPSTTIANVEVPVASPPQSNSPPVEYSSGCSC